MTLYFLVEHCYSILSSLLIGNFFFFWINLIWLKYVGFWAIWAIQILIFIYFSILIPINFSFTFFPTFRFLVTTVITQVSYLFLLMEAAYVIIPIYCIGWLSFFLLRFLWNTNIIDIDFVLVNFSYLYVSFYLDYLLLYLSGDLVLPNYYFFLVYYSPYFLIVKIFFS